MFLLCSLLLHRALASLDPIVVKGSKFFHGNGTQFFIRGVAYQQPSPEPSKYVDSLSNATRCQRDIPKLQALRTNTIRTYAIDPSLDHSACMSLLDAAGIYVLADLSNPVLAINRDSPSWTTPLFDHYKAVVDEMSHYSNVIGFFAGNEVTNTVSNTNASAFVKAAVRDTKAYVRSKMASGGRWMGVGYAANDDLGVRVAISQYFNCGNPDETIDYWGYNIYSWCGKSGLQRSGYAGQVDFFRNYSVPVFFAEYGCNTAGGAEGRQWDDTSALFSDQMSGVMSGGIVYEYFGEPNDYGLVNVINDTAVETMTNYGKLESVMATLSPSSTLMASYMPTNQPQACPLVSTTWAANEILPPTPNATICNCMFELATCVPSPSLNLSSVGVIFDTICGKDSKFCRDVISNSTSGVYGAYSMCSETQRLASVLNAWGENGGQCDFAGEAVAATPVAAAVATCSALLAAWPTAASSASHQGVSIVLGSSGFFIGTYLFVAVAVGAYLVL
ncbi:hypothetical protein GQ53DRAFT_822648 [Thozetella sp. PMI_491]|nr:hypothetical protein GQ53DRAFT_822648 [Thozetella sp. PMI_491]